MNSGVCVRVWQGFLEPDRSMVEFDQSHVTQVRVTKLEMISLRGEIQLLFFIAKKHSGEHCERGRDPTAPGIREGSFTMIRVKFGVCTLHLPF